MSRSYGISTYQKQKTAMMATRIGFFTFFKLGWSNKVESTPWRNKFDIGSNAKLTDTNQQIYNRPFVIPPPPPPPPPLPLNIR